MLRGKRSVVALVVKRFPRTSRSELHMARILSLALVIAVAACGCTGNSSSGPALPAGAGEAITETHAMLLEASYGWHSSEEREGCWRLRE